MHAVIGGVGYRNLRDHSLGVVISDELSGLAQPPSLRVEDLSYNPVAVGQWFADHIREGQPVTRLVLVSAVPRDDGRPPGTVCAYRWDQQLPSDEEIQRAVTDAVTGIIRVDNTLVVTRWMQQLPEEVFVVEVEPLEHEFGDRMSAPVAAAYPGVKEFVLRLATIESLGRTLPVTPLGGDWASTGMWKTTR